MSESLETSEQTSLLQIPLSKKKSLFPSIIEIFSRIRKWQQSIQKLRQIKDTIDYWPPLCKTKREEIVISRLRLGHCWFSHHHFMDTDSPRVPTICNFFSLEPMTVKHIFVECRSLRQRRIFRYLSCCNSSNSVSLADILGLDLVVSEAFDFLSNIYLLKYV